MHTSQQNDLTLTAITKEIRMSSFRKVSRKVSRFDSADNVAHAAIGIVLAILFLMSYPLLGVEKEKDLWAPVGCEEQDLGNVLAVTPDCPQCIGLHDAAKLTGLSPYTAQTCYDKLGAMGHLGVCPLDTTDVYCRRRFTEGTEKK